MRPARFGQIDPAPLTANEIGIHELQEFPYRD
jgi:hypothetical protein